MNPDQHHIDSIFLAAAEKATADAQAAYLDGVCGSDRALRERVERLLAAQSKVGSFLEAPAPAIVVTADEPAVSERPGTVIGAYKLLEQIGEGGFGVVFMAEQTQPVRRKVALKVLKPGMDTRQVVARFEAERQALALMDHPNIAHILDGGETASGRPYFVMELVRGIPITEFCDQSHLSIRERLELFVSVCQAVQHAHHKGIIHRDIKPTNVLVTLHDDKPVVKVIDFGIAKATGQQLTDKTLFTNFAQMIGTPLYMSPEQAQMSGLDVDTRSDIYSLGVLLYELLTGTTPFDKERLRTVGYDEIRRIIREEEPPKPSTRLSTVAQAATTASANRQSDPKRLSRLLRGELDWIVMKCLEKDRNRRYETANGLARDIQRYLTDEAVEARPPSAAYRLGKFLRRNKRLVLAASLVLLALSGGLIGAAYGLIEAENQREVTSFWQQAQRERDAAQLARSEAETAREGEKTAKREVEDAREKLAAVEYGLTIEVAHQEWRDNNVPATVALLDSTRADFRGWEWHYVHRLCHSDILTFKGHTAAVVSASFSADGTRVVTASADRTAKVWDAKTGAEILTLKGHTAAVVSALFSPVGSRIITASYDRTAKVWDATTGTEILTLKGHNTAVKSASFSPDGSRVLTGSFDGTVKVWDAKTAAEVLSFKCPRGPRSVFRSASFSPDGSRVVTANSDQTAKVWDAKTGAEVLSLKGHTDGLTSASIGIASASFSADGSRIVTGSQDRTAKVWDATTGAEVLTLKGHTDAVASTSFNMDGTRVVTASADRTAKVWDAKTGAEILTLTGHTNFVFSASFSPDGLQVVTASSDRTAKVWDLKRGAEPLTLKRHTAGVLSALFSPDGSRIVTGSYDRTAKVWDANTGAEILTLKGHASTVNWASFSPDGSQIVTASTDQTAKVWDATTGAEILTFKGHTRAVISASFSPDGSRIVTASVDKTAKVWDSKTGVEVLTITGPGEVVLSASFSPDGSQVVTAIGNKPKPIEKTAKVWDARTGAEVRTLKGHTAYVQSASFSTDGSRLLTGSFDRTAKVWDAKTGAEVLTLRGHTQEVLSAAFNPDASRVVTASRDGTTKVWDAKTGAEILTLKGHTATVLSASFSADGSRIVTASEDRTAKVWDARPVNREFRLKELAALPQ